MSGREASYHDIQYPWIERTRGWILATIMRDLNRSAITPRNGLNDGGLGQGVISRGK